MFRVFILILAVGLQLSPLGTRFLGPRSVVDNATEPFLELRLFSAGPEIDVLGRNEFVLKVLNRSTIACEIPYSSTHVETRVAKAERAQIARAGSEIVIVAELHGELPEPFAVAGGRYTTRLMRLQPGEIQLALLEIPGDALASTEVRIWAELQGSRGERRVSSNVLELRRERPAPPRKQVTYQE